MTNVWLYHINPKSPAGWTYGWNVDEPKTMLKTADREWPHLRKQMAVGDMLCIYSKGMEDKPDGVYIVGTIEAVQPGSGTFRWRPDRQRSAKLIAAPIVTDSLRSCFKRAYGEPVQQLPDGKLKAWLKLVGGRGTPAKGKAAAPFIHVTSKTTKTTGGGNPLASKANGLFGERFVLGELRRRYAKSGGYEVVHVAKAKPGADHDIAVYKGGKLVLLVEVKTRFGSPGDPVIISENELLCRQKHAGKHAIFIVYLATDKKVSTVLEVQAKNAFALSPRQHWLYPAVA